MKLNHSCLGLFWTFICQKRSTLACLYPVAKHKLHVVKNDQMKDHNRNLSTIPKYRVGIYKYTWLVDLDSWSPSLTIPLVALESTSSLPRRVALRVTIAY
jgi:hypothetical protein